jgi:hypothetical protein
MKQKHCKDCILVNDCEKECEDCPLKDEVLNAYENPTKAKEIG